MVYTDLDGVEAELKLASGAINSTTSPTDTQVYTWISQAEDKINSMTGNLYGQELASSQVFDWENNDSILRVEPYTSITSLHYNASSAGLTPSWVEKTEDTDFYTYGEEGEVEFITSAFAPLTGKKRFMLTYTKGATKVPGRVKMIAAMIAANKVVSATTANQAAEQSGGSVQVGTIKIDDPTSFSLGAFRSREAEVKSFFEDSIGTFKAHRITREYL